MTELKTYTVETPGAEIAYDVRQAEQAHDEPILMMIGSPMDASGFVSLAARFPDRTVVTYDPRGTGRSEKTDPTSESNPDLHADDLRRVIDAVGGGPIDLFASSGGAVNALALVAKHPDHVRTLVAHEPPAVRYLPDSEHALAATLHIHDTYLSDGFGLAMAKFITLISLKGEIPAEFPAFPVDPSMFGLPTEDDGSRNDALVGQNIVPTTHYIHDFEALRAVATRIVVAIGVESEGELAYRAGVAVAEQLGSTPVDFPSNHGGFLGGEFGQQGDPDGFATKLREVLAG
ncbi:alpha/beta fold hydrolase [Nocardia sp. NBC_01009]|uniref:alpha/beta fold hydrolase n=1 Tax=Nocardia sp. NBC_01009 TaxID=2975996 RepID=UPI003870633E|nr:alpha/beta hydrolase [Nocardia sp. NBC_01009]